MMSMTTRFATAFAAAIGSPPSHLDELGDRFRTRVLRLARRVPVTRADLGRPVAGLADSRLGYHLTLLKKLGAAAKRIADPRHQGLMAVGSFAATALRGATPGGHDPFANLGELLRARDTGLIKSAADERQYRQWWDNLQQPGPDGQGPLHRQHNDFWKGLREHVRSRLKGQGISGSLTTAPQLQRSIMRHAFQEADAADMAHSKRWGDAMHMTPPRKADQPMAPERYARVLGRELVLRIGDDEIALPRSSR